MADDRSIPLFVDLDGTLIKSDLLFESVLVLIKKSPLYTIKMLIWLILKGKARLKHEISSRISINYASLPYNNTLLAYLKDEKKKGRRLILITGSNYSFAQGIAQHIDIFDEVYGSDKSINLTSKDKLDLIMKSAAGGNFDYIGNCGADLSILKKSRKAIITNPSLWLKFRMRKSVNLEKTIIETSSSMLSWLNAARIYQWLKNILLGVPLLTSHSFNYSSLKAVIIAFFSFGLVASGTYIFNDLLDLSSDRIHPRKRKRPFAAGDIPIFSGIIALFILILLGLYIGTFLSKMFILTIIIYIVLTISYSLYFKNIPIIDVIILASLYTIRIIAGAIAIGVEISSWLLAFSMFIFLNLAMVKRCSELALLEKMDLTRSQGRDYRVDDFNVLTIMGIASGYVAIVVLALFIDSEGAGQRYSNPHILWLLCPSLLYWISRLWLKTTRNEIHDDPLIYSLRDKASWILLALTLCILFLAI